MENIKEISTQHRSTTERYDVELEVNGKYCMIQVSVTKDESDMLDSEVEWTWVTRSVAFTSEETDMVEQYVMDNY